MSDTIDRQAAIEIVKQIKMDSGFEAEKWVAINRLRDLTSVEPERKKGKWIIYTISPFDGEDVKCSECGQRGCAPYWDFCPNCGAKMEV